MMPVMPPDSFGELYVYIQMLKSIDEVCIYIVIDILNSKPLIKAVDFRLLLCVV